MRNIRPGSAKFFSKKKKRMLPEISVISVRRPSISSIDRSVAEQPGIFSKPWVLGAKAAQRVCVNIHRGQTQEHAHCTRTRSPAAKISRGKREAKYCKGKVFVLTVDSKINFLYSPSSLNFFDLH